MRHPISGILKRLTQPGVRRACAALRGGVAGQQTSEVRRSPVAIVTLTATLVAAGWLVFTPPALAQTATPAMTTIDALARAHGAVVGVRTRTVEGAPSADTLGEERRGSGVVISPDGLVLTIGYLMVEAEQIEIVTQDNRSWPAQAVAYDLATGFGLLKPLIPLRDMVPALIGSSQALNTGEALMAVTGPKAMSEGGADAEVSMTRLISQRSFTGTWEYHIDTALYTSPPVLAGGGNHSGAALFNHQGELVGIGSLLVGDAAGASVTAGETRRLPGNMFVPVDLLQPILGELQKTGSTVQSHRPWLGVTSNAKDGKVQILRVTKNSPAESAGLAPGDVVLEVDGTRVTTLESFYKKVWDHRMPDAEIRLTVQQADGGEVRSVALKAEDRLLMLRKPATI